VRVDRAVGDPFSSTDDVVFLHKDVLAMRDKVRLVVLFVVTLHDHFTGSALLSANRTTPSISPTIAGSLESVLQKVRSLSANRR